MTNVDWQPEEYRALVDLIRRPALDLIDHVPLAAPALIYDLGCGMGNVTRLVAERLPQARIVSLDSSGEMLAVARAEHPVLEWPSLEWIEADLARWTPPEPADIVLSTHALQILPDHRRLFPALLRWVRPGGAFAAQMPSDRLAPWAEAAMEVIMAGPWRERLTAAMPRRSVQTMAIYYGILAPHAAVVEIWESEYLHVLTGDNPVMRWLKVTKLWQILPLLDAAQRADFLAACAARIAALYPPRADGRTLFPIRRINLVATAQ